ncbi:MAG: TlpA family protein disulfide reductase [Bdellovibrionaceae bacterium]|nr:TlpA family protein disulfide reductase [Pseudobdellovibrionaceae bacterium]
MKALPLKIEKWLNAPAGYDLDLASEKVKVIHAFQMLCPGCVYYGIPQTVELFDRFRGTDVEVVGLHTVFEHHDVMTEAALQVFIDEWRLPFPVAIDKPRAGERLPETMKSYDLQGTPSTLVIDREGELVVKHFGIIQTEQLVEIVTKLSERTQTQKQA